MKHRRVSLFVGSRLGWFLFLLSSAHQLRFQNFFPSRASAVLCVLVARALVRIFARARQKRQLRGLRLD